MKIMFTIPSLGKGGAERVVTNLSNYFSCNGHDISIVVNRCKEIVYQLNEGINIIELDKYSKNSKNSFVRNIKRIKNMKKIVKKQKPDVIIAFLPMPSFRALLLKKKLNCKVIVSDRNNPEKEYEKFPLNFLMKWLYPKADGFVFQTNEQKNFFSIKIQKKSMVIANPLKEEFLKEESSKKENTIICVGRLVPQKNHKMLIQAFGEFSKAHPEYVLKIFGDGFLYEDIKKEIDEYNLTQKVFLYGFSNDIKQELLKAKLFVLSSNYEGMPNALMEAMACGLPCIATDCACGGPKELIEDGINGLLSEVGNKKMMEEKMNLVVSNEQLQKKLGENAKKIINKLNPESINNEWLKYIEKICEDKL